MAARGTLEDRVRKLERQNEDFRRLLVRPAVPPPRRGARFLAKLDGTLSAGSYAAASIWWHDGSSMVDSTKNVDVYDWFLGAGQSLPSGTLVQIEFFADSRWYVTHWQELAAIFYALVDKAGGVAETDATFNVDNVVVLSPVGGVSPGTSITGVNNILGFPADDDAKCLVFRKGHTSTYYGIPAMKWSTC